jgi:hypothetical protein
MKRSIKELLCLFFKTYPKKLRMMQCFENGFTIERTAKEINCSTGHIKRLTTEMIKITEGNDITDAGKKLLLLDFIIANPYGVAMAEAQLPGTSLLAFEIWYNKVESEKKKKVRKENKK